MTKSKRRNHIPAERFPEIESIRPVIGFRQSGQPREQCVSILETDGKINHIYLTASENSKNTSPKDQTRPFGFAQGMK
ncbi:MAG: hypothetical protein K9G62_04135 [Alphaproteobacteria bacterium]|nr:hypothetical protein [Alphaproteobacteria bacterium]